MLSYALAGAIMLTLPPPWITQRGGTVQWVGNKTKKQQTKHWFPYRPFAWMLILCQVSIFLFYIDTMKINATAHFFTNLNLWPFYSQTKITRDTDSLLLPCRLC